MRLKLCLSFVIIVIITHTVFLAKLSVSTQRSAPAAPTSICCLFINCIIYFFIFLKCLAVWSWPCDRYVFDPVRAVRFEGFKGVFDLAYHRTSLTLRVLYPDTKSNVKQSMKYQGCLIFFHMYHVAAVIIYIYHSRCT